MTSPNRRCKKQMQNCIDELGIPLKVAWNPDPSKEVHGKIENDNLYIYDADVEAAWQTLTHEVLEWRMKEPLRVYRETINSLIELVEKLSYRKKEEFIESVPAIVKAINDAKNKSRPSI